MLLSQSLSFSPNRGICHGLADYHPQSAISHTFPTTKLPTTLPLARVPFPSPWLLPLSPLPPCPSPLLHPSTCVPCPLTPSPSLPPPETPPAFLSSRLTLRGIARKPSTLKTCTLSTQVEQPEEDSEGTGGFNLSDTGSYRSQFLPHPHSHPPLPPPPPPPSFYS